MKNTIINLMILSTFVSSLTASTIILPQAPEADASGAQVLAGTQITYQFVYSSTLLSGIPIGNQFTGMQYRANGNVNKFPAPASSWTNYDIQISKSLNSPGSLSSTFADNIDTDVVMVRSGPLTFDVWSYPGGQIPNDFGPVITFSTPYTYTGGDLLFTIRHTGNGFSDWPVDASQASSLVQGRQGFTYTATTSFINLGVPVIQLTTVPEPSIATLLLAGGFMTCVSRRRRTYQLN